MNEKIIELLAMTTSCNNLMLKAILSAILGNEEGRKVAKELAEMTQDAFDKVENKMEVENENNK